MRLSVILLACALAGIVGGGWLIGHLVGVGAGVVFDSLCVGAWAVLRDDGQPDVPQVVQGAPTLQDVLDRHRQAS